MKIYGERYSFYQWDLNQKITSPKLKEGDEVHFGSSVTGEALTVEAYRLGAAVVADVPNVLLQQTQKILAYRFVTDGESRLTVCKSTFDVKARPKPADYVYTETECATVKGYVYKALQEAKESGEFNGKDGKDGLNGKDGVDGKNGVDGKDGVNGYTPEKGVDYFTEADKEEMVEAVLSALPDNREVAY